MDLNGMMDARNADVKMGWPPAIQWCAIINGQRKFLCNNSMYHKVASSNTSRLGAHAGLFQIAYERDFRSLCTVTF